MEKEIVGILTEYTDAAARVKYLRKTISKLEEKHSKLMNTDYGIVSDTVTRGKKGKQPLGTVKITGFHVEEYWRTENNLKARKILLKQREEELLALLEKAERFIEEIKDIELRNIFSFYYIEDMTWVQVAHAMNHLYGKKIYTSDSCRKKHDRFFEKKF